MFDRSAIFRNAHAIARRTQGQYQIANTYRESFAIALRQCYAAAKDGAARKARMEAGIERAKAEAAKIIHQRAVRDAYAEVRHYETQDRLGVAGLVAYKAAQTRYAALVQASA